MMFRRNHIAILALVLGCAGLSACGQRNWRAAAIADAEDQIRTNVNDPSAEFSDVQVNSIGTTPFGGYLNVSVPRQQLVFPGRILVAKIQESVGRVSLLFWLLFPFIAQIVSCSLRACDSIHSQVIT